MSIFVDPWVKKAMVDDTIVAEQLLLLHHHQPSLHGLLTPWLVRQRRTPRMPIPTARPDWTNPNSPLSWTASLKPSGSKAVNQSETTNAKRFTKKRAVDKKSSHKTLNEIKRDVKLKLTERKNLKDELAAMKLAFEKAKALNDMLKRKKLDVMSQRPMEKVQPFLDTPEFVVAHYGQSNLVSSAQAVEEKTLQDETLVCAASASAPSNQEDINGQKPFLLPDLNVPPNEYFTDFVLD